MTHSRSLLALTALLAALGCDNRRTGGDGGETCATDLECDDGLPCTQDSCGVEQTCRHITLDERCEDGLFCVAGRGCVSTRSCTGDADCDDTFDCTIDTCGVGGICSHTALNERCSDPTPMCVVGEGCIADDRCNSAADCDDDVPCTMDSCTVDRECRNTAMNDSCTGADEVCHPSAGCIVIQPCENNAQCDDGNFCNGAEVCSAEFGCSPPEAPRVCDDSDDCTVDSCDATADQCVFACDTTRAECNCPVDTPTCQGTFTLTPAPSDSCASGMVNYNLSTVTFTTIAGTLDAMPAQAHFNSLSDTTAPVCPTFVAVAEVPGGTTERFTLSGTFSDDDTFTGMFVADYGGFGIIAGCQEGSTAVTGTRQ